MKLSEAIMLNGMTKPQGYGAYSFYSDDAPCALGGALQAIGYQPSALGSNYRVLEDAWPWAVTNDAISCPLCASYEAAFGVVSVIWHLNDQHEWTRQQIAEWVARIEPAEIPASLSSDENAIVISSARVGDSPKGERRDLCEVAND